MKNRIFLLTFLTFTALAITAQQTDAPNANLTYYYRQTGVVRNNTLGAGDNTGQFITFTRRGCYDSDRNGMQAGDGFLAYQGIGNDALRNRQMQRM